MYLLPERTKEYEAALEGIRKEFPGVAVHTVLLTELVTDHSGLGESQRKLWKHCVLPILEACFQERPALGSVSIPG